jgi:hypothetical protein
LFADIEIDRRVAEVTKEGHLIVNGKAIARQSFKITVKF